MQPEDKRVRRTKRLLRQALAELMQQKQFNEITVTDVVRRADINRGTFYVHYRDVYDLREKIEQEMIETFRQMVYQEEKQHKISSLRPILERAIAYLDENRILVSALLRSSNAHNFETNMLRVLEERPLLIQRMNPAGQRYEVRFVVSGLAGMLEMWMLEENELPRAVLVDQMDTLLKRFFAT